VGDDVGDKGIKREHLGLFNDADCGSDHRLACRFRDRPNAWRTATLSQRYQIAATVADLLTAAGPITAQWTVRGMAATYGGQTDRKGN
jgi:hypothetical protein